MAFTKGHKKIGGKRKGVPNKQTTLLKDMILNALDQAGGQEYLFKQALAEPTAFLTLIGKILPKEIDANVKASVLVHNITEADQAIINQYINNYKGKSE